MYTFGSKVKVLLLETGGQRHMYVVTATGQWGCHHITLYMSHHHNGWARTSYTAESVLDHI